MYLGIMHSLYSQLEGKKNNNTFLMSEPRNHAKTHAKECQGKLRAAVHSSRPSGPIVMEEKAAEAPLAPELGPHLQGAGPRWLWTCVTTSRACVVESEAM